MKKRIISLLLAVLMLTSMLPTSVFAADELDPVEENTPAAEDILDNTQEPEEPELPQEPQEPELPQESQEPEQEQ